VCTESSLLPLDADSFGPECAPALADRRHGHGRHHVEDGSQPIRRQTCHGRDDFGLAERQPVEDAQAFLILLAAFVWLGAVLCRGRTGNKEPRRRLYTATLRRVAPDRSIGLLTPPPPTQPRLVTTPEMRRTYDDRQ
jgi:hypothetical protein